MTIDLRLGDCLEVMKEIPDNSIDAVITDPPYSLGFMGKDWDKAESPKHFQDWCNSWGKECLRMLMPGGFLFSFGGTRTHHRLVCGLEDAGFVIRDELEWVYFSGFPKAQDLAMLVEKKMGGNGKVVGEKGTCPDIRANNYSNSNGKERLPNVIKQPTILKAKEWVGWKTPALKPAHEPICVAQKPCEGSITENVLKHDVGGFNIDACRIPFESKGEHEGTRRPTGGAYGCAGQNVYGKGTPIVNSISAASGRFPANVVLTDEVFEEQSKFFLIPKAAASEKHEFVGKNVHPTVKPVRLMEWLVKLCTKPEQTVLDPFMGSGTTGLACKALNRNFIGIEKCEEYFKIAQARLAVGKDLNSFIDGV